MKVLMDTKILEPIEKFRNVGNNYKGIIIVTT